jgi:hypothetical protein
MSSGTSAKNWEQPHLSGGATSFQAVLHEHSAAGTWSGLALPGNDLVIGRLEVVAGDHVTVEDVDGRRLVVSSNLILAVLRSSEHQ